MRTVLSLAAIALLSACATDPSTPAGTQATASAPEEKVLCGMEEPTGSRLKVKRCWTQEQAAQQSQESRKALERSQAIKPVNNPR